ncbi:MAG: T9SS type A sorting domain-containing protein [Flavobacteriales bacterium]|nr:T9SS type A sorting domain-containing protein [Flavobacteriales bacterium]
MGHNGDDTTDVTLGRGDIPSYDAGAYIRHMYWQMDTFPNVQNKYDAKMGVFKDVMWAGIPLLDEDFDFNNPKDIPSDVTIRLRVQRPYGKYYSTPTDPTFTSNLNDGNPMYNFNLDALAVRTGVDTIAENKLALINVVPNPYFAFSDYETSQIDHRIKITNLPVKCTVSIYNLNGTLIRQFDRDDNTITSIDWDLKNHVSVPIASGVYLIHINAPGIGERVIKWFGVLRPIDLDSF